MGVRVELPGCGGLGLFVEEEPETGSDALESFFGEGGALAQAFGPDYKPRVGQIAYARQIEASVAARRHTLAEAPCGTGKTFGYLFPAVMRITDPKLTSAADRRNRVAAQERATDLGLSFGGDSGDDSGDEPDIVPQLVIATANIALQEQLISKDLPFIQRILHEQYDRRFTFGLLKGWNNYLCPVQVAVNTTLGHMQDTNPEYEDQIAQIFAWMGTTGTGDKSELPLLPHNDVWRRFSIQATECPGYHCPKKGECPAMRARRRGRDAHVTVTNYHMLAANIKVQTQFGGSGFFRSHDVLVLDEVHEGAGIFRDALGVWVNEGMLHSALHNFNKCLMIPDPSVRETKAQIEALFDTIRAYAESNAYKDYLKTPLASAALTHLIEFYTNAAAAADAILSSDVVYPDDIITAATRGSSKARTVLEGLCHLMAISDAHVVSLEASRQDKYNYAIKVHYLEPRDLLKSSLYRVWDSVVGTSATVTCNGSFGFAQSEIGAPVADTDLLTVESPFDFEKQSLLVLPEGIAEDTNSDAFRTAVGHYARRTVELARGRTLLLFTSYKNMEIAQEAMRGLPYPMYAQGTMPRTALVEAFKRYDNAVLMGVASMWTGIDVVGDSLSCLFIDKLPFPMRSDPVMCAIQDRNDDWFKAFSLPHAVIRLKQGTGRLIRSVTDRGVCVILDPRLQSKHYGAGVLNSLPRMQRTGNIDDVAHFLDTGLRPADPLPW